LKVKKRLKEDDHIMKKVDLSNLPEIPNLGINVGEIDVLHDYCSEPLQEVNGVFFDSRYLNLGYPGAVEKFMLRKTVVEKILEAQSKLPEGLHLKIYDAYRSIVTQKYLWNEIVTKYKKEYPELSNLQLDKLSRKKVSNPFDKKNPPLHCTGGAVDLTICDEMQNDLNMGGDFDSFTDIDQTNYYENSDNLDVKYNRRLLYYVMTSVGFVNYPSEWWHFDYGDTVWAYFKKKPCCYNIK
jgi:D-alanyl-D-alanine dipeptidase